MQWPGPRAAPRDPARDVEDVFKLHTLGRTQVLHETRPIEAVNEAFDDVEHARNKAPRVVLTV